MAQEEERVGEIRCGVCMHRCRLRPGQVGLCGARSNEGGRNVCVNYGKVTGLALDPVEKKPLSMFCPGKRILSVGSFGCNLRCPFCQNHEISMRGPGEVQVEELPPELLVRRAEECAPYGNIGVAFTYNEPLVGYEYVRDAARLARERGMRTVVVTNGSVAGQVEEEILPWVDAMNIDLKGFSEEYYARLGGDLGTVQEFIRRAVSGGCHVELTTLIVPGENDSDLEMRELSAWIASLDREIPLHVTRFFPRYHMRDREAAPVERVYELAEVARRRLSHVFTGNC